MDNFKSGFVSIVGKTNVGKSTLLNALVGEKIAIMANKAQTTRTAIRGIVNRTNAQIIFIDTPGIHKPKTKLNEIMVNTAYDNMHNVDVVLMLVDATKDYVGKAETIIIEKLQEAKSKNVILVINKIDLIQKTKLLSLMDAYSKLYDFKEIIPISALKKDGIEKILSAIESLLPTGPAYYDIEEYTDQTMRQLVEEIIREKALRFLDQEVPHGIYVEVEKYEQRKTKNDEDIYDIDATIYCLRNSHKGIIIGKNGAMLKKIGQSVRYELEKMIDTKVNLKLWVKVREDWQEKDSIVKKFEQK